MDGVEHVDVCLYVCVANTEGDIANCLCKFLRLCPLFLDHAAVITDFATDATHIPRGGFLVAGLHHRHLTLGRVMQEPPKSSCHGTEPPCRPVLHAAY